MDDDEPTCRHCGGSMEWEDCYVVGCDDGYIDMYEDDPLWYDEGDMEPCDTCDGRGGWWVCGNAACVPKE